MKNKAILEGLLFVVGEEGLSIEQITDVLDISEEEAKSVLKDLKHSYEEEDILKYTSYIFTISKYDKWFEEMPFEFYRIRDFEKAKEIRDKIFSFNYPLLGRYGSLEV